MQQANNYTADQLTRLENKNYTFSCNTYAAGTHYTWRMQMGGVFPTTRAQANHYLRKGCVIGMLNSKDVQIIEALLNKHGFAGQYCYTKSSEWVRLQNHQDLRAALKLEFSL